MIIKVDCLVPASFLMEVDDKFDRLDRDESLVGEEWNKLYDELKDLVKSYISKRPRLLEESVIDYKAVGLPSKISIVSYENFFKRKF